MLTLIAILLLILIGLVLIVVEIIFVPGTTLVGVLGLGFAGLGVFLGFVTYGDEVGLWLLVGTSVASIGVLLLSLRNKSWRQFSLDKTINSRVNEDDVMVEVGARGITLSALRPMGKAELEGRVFEVRTFGHHLPEKTEVRVSKVVDRTIYVEPLTLYK
jgi:membrane-bound ClpP family serine protease